DVDGLPVVNRDDPTRLVGVVTRDGLTAAYRAVLEEEYLRERGAGPPETPPPVRQANSEAAAPVAEAILTNDGAMPPSESTEKANC
ncbi:MAG TPA: hypothetical protein VG868_08745, partial [Casimicrobiaceae bacterium]|nr:hypothetical protein [Casimicrobiaceae bacterium]